MVVLDESEPLAPAAPEALSPALRIARERGPMTRQVRDAALRAGGEEAWRALLASVSPSCRARFSQPVGYFEWVPSELALELHEAWRRRVGEDFMAARGEDAAREILGGAHRWMLRLATPGMLVQAFPRLFAFYYTGGRAAVDRVEADGAVLSLWAWGYPDAWFREGVAAWISVALASTGTRGVRVAYAAPAPGTCHHRYLARWGTDPAGPAAAPEGP